MKKAMIMAAVAVFVGVVAGCSSGSTSDGDDKVLRKQLSQEKVDINKVPADQKAMVKGFMDRADQMRAKAQANGGAK